MKTTIIAVALLLAPLCCGPCGLLSRLVPSGSPAGLVGQPARAFSLPDTEGHTVSLEQFAGQVVLLDFWASWCGPCREALPVTQTLHQRYAQQGLVVLGINQGESQSVVADFVRDNGYTFPMLLDTAQRVGDDYRVRGIPTVILIDRDGIIRHVRVGSGPAAEESLSKEIETLLAERGT